MYVVNKCVVFILENKICKLNSLNILITGTIIHPKTQQIAEILFALPVEHSNQDRNRPSITSIDSSNEQTILRTSSINHDVTQSSESQNPGDSSMIKTTDAQASNQLVTYASGAGAKLDPTASAKHSIADDRTDQPRKLIKIGRVFYYAILYNY